MSFGEQWVETIGFIYFLEANEEVRVD